VHLMCTRSLPEIASRDGRTRLNVVSANDVTSLDGEDQGKGCGINATSEIRGGRIRRMSQSKARQSGVLGGWG